MRNSLPILFVVLLAGCAPSAAAVQAAIAQTQAAATQTQAALATATPAPTAVPVATPVPTVETRTLTFPGGDKYVGEVKNGKPNGQGALSFADGCRYTGEWKDGKRVPCRRAYVVSSSSDNITGPGSSAKASGALNPTTSNISAFSMRSRLAYPIV